MTNAIRIQLPNTVKSIVESVLTGLNTKSTELQQENNSLRERVSILERIADTAEQYSRRNCLRISGVPAQTEEDTDDYVVQMSQAIGDYPRHWPFA